MFSLRVRVQRPTWYSLYKWIMDSLEFHKEKKSSEKLDRHKSPFSFLGGNEFTEKKLKNILKNIFGV